VAQTVYEYLGCREREEIPVKQQLGAFQGVSSRFEYQRRKRGFDISLAPLRSAEGTIIGCIGVALDITERKKTEEEIRYQAAHDGLTGLVNYREFLERLGAEVKRADCSHRSFGLLQLDLDELKKINDRLGHLAGNRALKRLARVMRDHCRTTDVAARYGGDEFALLMIDADHQMAEQVAERIANCLHQQSDVPLLCVSIGMAVYPEDGRTAQDLLESADQRRYLGKKAAALRPRTEQGDRAQECEPAPQGIGTGIKWRFAGDLCIYPAYDSYQGALTRFSN
jgi:diguanylate cyclase (GGDEF)-like protein